MRVSNLPIARLGVEVLEDRTLLNASLLAYNGSTGSWETAALNSGNVLSVSAAVRWDPYHMTAVVQGDFTGSGETDVAGWSNLGYWVVGVPKNGQYQTTQW